MPIECGVDGVPLMRGPTDELIPRGDGAAEGIEGDCCASGIVFIVGGLLI